MPRGLKIPVGVSPSGGLAFVEHDENDNKTIMLALGAGDNENAFQQDITLGDGMVFDNADPTMRARVVARIVEIFRDFERQKRFKLHRHTIEWASQEGSQVQTLRFTYLNIESDEIRQFDSARANGGQ